MQPGNAVLACVALLLAACASTTTITSPNPGTTLVLKDKALSLPASTSISTSSFGNYEFKVTEADAPDAEPFYGMLPLALKKGRMVVGILLLSPTMLLNLRGAFRYYEIDARRHSIRYRDDEAGPWVDYQVKPEEDARARAYFEPEMAPVQEDPLPSH